MTVRTVPSFLQAGSHPAEETRLALAGFLGSDPGVAFTAGVGALDPGHGVTAPAGLKVSPSGPSMNVSVAPGACFIRGSQSQLQGVYHVVNDAALVLSISPADATNPRRDLVVATVRDANYSGASNDARIIVVTGTPAAVPADPAVPANSLVLARIQVNAAPDATIVAGDITDLRPYAGTPYREVTCTSTTRPPLAAIGTRIYETDTGDRLVYYGATTGWQPPWGEPWGEILTTTIADFQFNNVLTVSAGTASVAMLLNRRYRIDADAEVSNGAVTGVIDQWNIARSTATGVALTSTAKITLAVAGGLISRHVMGVYTAPSTGSLGFKVVAQASASATLQGLINIRLTFTDIGPATSTPPAS